MENYHEIEDDSKRVYFTFADDFIFYQWNKELIWTVTNLQHKIVVFNAACVKRNLSFNMAKTNCMYVAKGGRRQIKLMINGVSTEQVKSIKILGRTISNSLSVREHCDRAINESKNNVNLLKMLTPIKSGLQPHVALNIYKMCIRSKIEYAMTTFANAPKTINNRLKSFQNSSLRRCLGLSPSTPLHVVYTMSGELVPERRAKLLAFKELLRIKQFSPDFYNIVMDNCGNKSSYGTISREFQYQLQNTSFSINFASHSKLTIRKNELLDKKSNISKIVIIQQYLEKADLIGLMDIQFLRQMHLFTTMLLAVAFIISSSLFAEIIAIYHAIRIAVEDNRSKIIHNLIANSSLRAVEVYGPQVMLELVSMKLQMKWLKML
ncbi:hypothetical protein CVS40_10553 [Lucilia cuprina]|nr:hypothetical protein CVS40_10553 [Lucilia cuprina]